MNYAPSANLTRNVNDARQGKKQPKVKMIGFIRQQEQKLAMRLLAWHYEKNAIVLPLPSELRQQADRLVEDAHKIARERGRNVMSIMKDLVAEIKKG